jgi:hypothetical protein
MHSDAARFADTDWPQILALYDHLVALTPGPSTPYGLAQSPPHFTFNQQGDVGPHGSGREMPVALLDRLADGILAMSSIEGFTHSFGDLPHLPLLMSSRTRGRKH